MDLRIHCVGQRYCVCLAILVALALGTLSAAPSEPDSLLGKPAPNFVRKDLENRPVGLGDLRGHVVLLNFWATWCASCQIEMPRFVSWQSKYGPQGLQIIGVSVDDESDPVESLLREHPVNYPILMGDETIGLLYGGVLGLPVSYLIDRHGVIRARFKGQADLNAMESAIQGLLRSH